mmetsp:Transcript_43731/g.124695  ORF Transcript_43731/g.124695 Transcript_43731/m.124695 type:complete len:263 (+) Transcript_43731:1022-1810(+)
MAGAEGAGCKDLQAVVRLPHPDDEARGWLGPGMVRPEGPVVHFPLPDSVLDVQPLPGDKDEVVYPVVLHRVDGRLCLVTTLTRPCADGLRDVERQVVGDPHVLALVVDCGFDAPHKAPSVAALVADKLHCVLLLEVRDNLAVLRLVAVCAGGLVAGERLEACRVRFLADQDLVGHGLRETRTPDGALQRGRVNVLACLHQGAVWDVDVVLGVTPDDAADAFAWAALGGVAGMVAAPEPVPVVGVAVGLRTSGDDAGQQGDGP